MQKFYYYIHIFSKDGGDEKIFCRETGIPFPTPIGTDVFILPFDDFLKVVAYEHHLDSNETFRILLHSNCLEDVYVKNFEKTCLEMAEAKWEEVYSY